jgi:hypothetical protein
VSKNIDDSKHWHDQAEEMRALADRMVNHQTKTTMHKLAADYDMLGNRACRFGHSRSLEEPRSIKSTSRAILRQLAASSK